MAAQPGGDAQLRVAVARRDVDVVHAVLEQDLQRAVRVALGRAASAAAPKIARDDSCPVVPKGARSIIGSTLRRARGVRIAPSQPDEEEDPDFDAAIEEGEQISSRFVEYYDQIAEQNLRAICDGPADDAHR